MDACMIYPMRAMDQLIRDYGNPYQEALLWERLSEQIRPAGFVAIDILRIEAGFFSVYQRMLHQSLDR